ncbi:MAG: D-2-hydroxyacid dehydrogenase (NADP+) [Oceanospirillaceae bacterium]|jgi:D-2-hydroxyacid dehydrogenase (NADP+)
MTQARQNITSILIIHAYKGQFSDILEGQHPEIEFHYAQNSEEVEQLLPKAQPQAVFSINHGELPPSTMRMAGLYPSVQWFHVGGSGIDKMLPWSNDYALMTNGAGVLARFLAETVLGAMLAMNNNLQHYLQQQVKNNWQPREFKPLCEQTLLIVGLGAVGERVADNAKALGMRVIATRRSAQNYCNVDQLYREDQLLEALAQADFVSLHLPLNEQTAGSFSYDVLSAMKQGACLINTARGGIVDEDALQTVLKHGPLKAAFFDVFAQEPLASDSPLWQFENLMISPHMADGVYGFERHYLQFFSENITCWNTGETLKNIKRFD